MRHSRDHILTSHAGSLPRPDDLIEANRAHESGGAADEQGFQARLRSSVVDVVRRQREIGVDVASDGEFGKSMGHRVNYRAWWSYSFQRLGGLELGQQGLYDMPARRSRPGEVVLTSFGDRRDRLRFAAAYADPDSGVSTGPRASIWPVCVGPLTYTGPTHVAQGTLGAGADNVFSPFSSHQVDAGDTFRHRLARSPQRPYDRYAVSQDQASRPARRSQFGIATHHAKV